MIYELDLKRVYEILKFIEQNEGATTNEIHKRLKISKSCLLRYLRRLEQIGCIKRVEDKAVYFKRCPKRHHLTMKGRTLLSYLEDIIPLIEEDVQERKTEQSF